MTRVKFLAKLLRPGPLTVAPIPKELAIRNGLLGRRRVKGTIDAISIATTVMAGGPGTEEVLGGTRFAVCVNRELLRKLGKKAGDSAEVSLEPDAGPVVILLSSELEEALRAKPRVKRLFDKLAPTHRKAFAQWVASARTVKTRDRRLLKTLSMVREGKTLR